MRYVWSAVGFIFSGIALYYFFQFVPSNLPAQILANYDVFLVGSAILVPAYVIRGYKTWLLLGELKTGRAAIAGSLYASIALNNVLPFRLGDILRLFYLRTALKIGLVKATTALLIERVVDLLVILALFVLTAATIAGGKISELAAALFWDLSAGWLLVAAATVVVGSVGVVNFRSTIWRVAAPVLSGLGLNTTRTVKLLVAAVLQWVLEIMVLSLVTSRLLFDVDGGQAVLSSFMANLSTLIPSAPGYVGTFEVAGIVPFKLLSGQITEAAAVFVILYHLVIWTFSTVLGMLSGVWLVVGWLIARPLEA